MNLDDDGWKRDRLGEAWTYITLLSDRRQRARRREIKYRRLTPSVQVPESIAVFGLHGVGKGDGADGVRGRGDDLDVVAEELCAPALKREEMSVEIFGSKESLI